MLYSMGVAHDWSKRLSSILMILRLVVVVVSLRSTSVKPLILGCGSAMKVCGEDMFV